MDAEERDNTAASTESEAAAEETEDVLRSGRSDRADYPDNPAAEAPGGSVDDDGDSSPGLGDPAGDAVVPAPRPPWTDAHVRDALVDQPRLVRRIIYCESSNRVGAESPSLRYDPYARGGLGEVGPAQLLPGRGNGLSIFYSWGGADPNSPYEAVWFVNEVIRRGMVGGQYPRSSVGCQGSP